MGGDNDHRQRRAFVETLQHFHAVDAAHAEIGDDAADLVAGNLLKRIEEFARVWKGADLCGEGSYKFRNGSPRLGVVVYDKNDRFGHLLDWLDLAPRFEELCQLGAVATGTTASNGRERHGMARGGIATAGNGGAEWPLETNAIVQASAEEGICGNRRSTAACRKNV